MAVKKKAAKKKATTKKKVAVKKKTSTPKPKAKPTAKPKAKTAVAKKKAVIPEFHQVKAGDTLFRISRRYGLTVEQLRSYNNLAQDAAIYPGQKLKLKPNGKP